MTILRTELMLKKLLQTVKNVDPISIIHGETPKLVATINANRLLPVGTCSISAPGVGRSLKGGPGMNITADIPI